MDIPQAVLVDAQSWPHLKEVLLDEIRNANDLVGVDIETKDDRRHDGLNRFMKVNDEGKKSGSKKLIFDTNRTDITGFSVYVEPNPYAYYVNLMHADVENRLPWEEAKLLLNAVPNTKLQIAHNAPYELTMFRKCLGYDLGENLGDSMQLAVSLFNGDTYSQDEFMQPGLGEIPRLFPAIIKAFGSYNPAVSKTLDAAQSELFYKVVAKESTAAHSYVGYIKTMTYGYSLKALTKRFLGYTQATFAEVLGDKAHMGQLTGAEACAYGADDAWTCVKLWKKLLDMMISTNPQVVPTFFAQENPMIHTYSEVWGGGVRIDLKKVKEHQALERAAVCSTLRTMKAAVKDLLPFPVEMNDKLQRYSPKNAKSGKCSYDSEKYRGNVTRWAESPDSEDDYTQLYQVRSALSEQWAAERGIKKSDGMSINYYQQIRCFLYDLCGCSFQLHEGKIQSDGEARGVMYDRWVKKALENGVAILNEETKSYDMAEGADLNEYLRFNSVLIVLTCYQQLAESEQVIKLFINLYLDLTDPETGRVYLTLNSLLASRRMALATPNLSQLPKFGGSAYVRSFFIPDEPWIYDEVRNLWVQPPPSINPPAPCEPGVEQVLLSADWSGIELVLIGDASGDKTFAEAYGQLPHGDPHTGTAADLLGLSVPDFKKRPDPKKDRNEIGKVANFNYWYSGALGTVAGNLGWGSDQMWEAVERYRKRYPGGEAWRVGLIQRAKEFGYVVLPDKHTRIRFESTYTWAHVMRAKFEQYGNQIITTFGDMCIKKIQTRSGNQAVNSMIQGTCATLAKRTAIAMRKAIKEQKFNCTFKFPVHDEFVYSTQVNQLWRFMALLHHTMCNHPEIVKTLKLDASMAIGLNYQAYHVVKNPFGQIELGELTKLPFIPESRWGKKATEEEVMLVCDYLFGRLRVENVNS